MRPISAALGAMLIVGTAAREGRAQVFLPGTQPEEGGIELAKTRQCERCHSKTPNGQADPFFSWSGSMMGQAARDPVFRAALAIANQDVPGSGEYCVRCHAPRGWLEGRSSAPDGSKLTDEDMHGVSCDVCHRLVDPKAEDASEYAKQLPPGYGNGMMVADPRNIVRGPYAIVVPEVDPWDQDLMMPHDPIQSDFQGSSELCGTCHDVSNPLAARDINTQKPHTYGVIERTYSEWLLSDFAKLGPDGTCQSCHFPLVQGGGRATRFDSPHRDHFASHSGVGGSVWAPEAVAYLWKGEVDRLALKASSKRARALLQTAADLELIATGSRSVRLTITNQSGHKLPTGYPEGRRMWVHVRFLDAEGKTLKELGAYGDQAGTYKGEPVTSPTLLDPSSTRVYEAVPGLSRSQASKHGLAPGKSFHFVLNDIVVKDNRIPPRGFNNTAFARHLAQPKGASYRDGQHWDQLNYTAPGGTKTVEVQLLYQSVSWEYIQFLGEQNTTDEWGDKLYEAWRATDMCPPEAIATARLEL